jgi:hypothetical protein
LKIYFNKKLSDLVWSNYLACFLCFWASYQGFKDYKEEKRVFYEGLVCIGIIQKCNCTYSTRISSTVDLKIEGENDNLSLKTTSDFCFESKIGDTLLVKFIDKDLPLLKYDSSIIDFRKTEMYLSISIFFIGILFLFLTDEETYLLNNGAKINKAKAKKIIK